MTLGMKKKILSWLWVILWLSVIYWFSNQPDLKSELQYFWDLIFRKIAHMAEYFVLCFLFYKAINNYKLEFKKVIIVSLILTLIAAGLDEFHQYFTRGRSASAIDVIIDGIGSLILIVILLKSRYESLFNKQILP